MVSVAQSAKKKSKKPIDLSPIVTPNPKAIEIMESFLELTMMAFRSGIIQSAGDWGIVAAHLQAFAHYVDERCEFEIESELFYDGLVGDQRFPLLSETLTRGYDSLWKEIAPNFIAERRGKA